ncbi:MAG: hypothetical protein GF353_20225 [Candidatus Lokiarchaeota archaeon]|nr:hypothetical protein [Candidatus Lokiarchaeota archaeon]
MKDADLKERLIELRAAGTSYENCAKELGKSKTTVIKWTKELQKEIDNVEYFQTQNILDQYKLTRKKRIEFLSAELDKMNRALASKNYEELCIKDLLALREKYENELKEATKDTEYRTGEYTEFDPLADFELGKVQTEKKIPL